MKQKIRTILILGGGGFIGRNLVESLSHDVHVVAPTHKELDLLQEHQVTQFLTRYSFDTIISAATHDATQFSLKDRSTVLSSNLRMFFHLAKNSHLFGRMFYFGSGAEFNLNHYQPKMNEEYFGTHVPQDDYGLSKYIMNTIAMRSTNIINLRLFGVYGPYEDWRIRFISNAICKTLVDHDITMHQNVFFDYLWINDLVAIVKRLMSTPRLQHSSYNVCTGQTIDLKSLASIVKKISGKNIKIISASPGLKAEYSGDNQRLLSEIGDITFTPHKQAIQSLYEWYDAHRDIINPTLL